MDAPHRKRRKRREVEHEARYLTFSTYRRLPLFRPPGLRDEFARVLERAHAALGFVLRGWVLMPEHVHLIVVPLLPQVPVPRILNAVKAPLSRVALSRWREKDARILERLTDARGVVRFWQAGGGYDRNVYRNTELFEKLRYMHWNPVKRGLCALPEDWAWSSARWYKGARTGPVRVDSHLIGW